MANTFEVPDLGLPTSIGPPPVGVSKAGTPQTATPVDTPHASPKKANVNPNLTTKPNVKRSFAQAPDLFTTTPALAIPKAISNKLKIIFFHEDLDYPAKMEQSAELRTENTYSVVIQCLEQQVLLAWHRKQAA